jgi:hypothetical protein
MDKFPTNYDSFSNNLQIAKKLTEYNEIKSKFRDLDLSFGRLYVGFIYLVELVIIHLLLNFETLIQDEYLLERVKWGEVTLGDQDMQKTLRDHPEGKYILELNSIRRDLSKIRNAKDLNENLLEKTLFELNEKLLEIDSQIREKYFVKKIVDDSDLEKKLVVEKILFDYNYIKFDTDFYSKSKGETPIYPGHLVFYLMPDEQRTSYNLMNSRIKQEINNYFNGYVACLQFLYTSFMPEKRNYFHKKLFPIKTWAELNDCSDEIYHDLKLEKLANRQIYDYELQSTINLIEKERIENYSELRRVLRDRRIRLFNNFSLDESILIHYLHGALDLIEIGAKGEKKTKLEIIEFEMGLSYDRLVYFGIFNPLKGWISDGSHWLFFKDNSEFCSSAEIHIHNLSEKYPDIIQYRKYSIQEELIKKYLAVHTYSYERKKHKNEILKASRNIASELFALFYLMKINCDKNIINFDCHRDIPDTDIDVFVETPDEIMIGQVKPYFFFDPDERKSILKNFDLITKHFSESGKPNFKILFLMSRKIPDSEIYFVVKDLPKGNEMVPLDGYIEKKEQKVIAEFTKNHIKIIYLDEILEKLESNGNYDGMINQMKIIFMKKEINPLHKESFLWQ